MKRHPTLILSPVIWTVEVEGEGGKTIKQVAPGIKFESTDSEFTAGRSVGADSVETLIESGLSQAQVEGLIKEGLVYQAQQTH